MALLPLITLTGLVVTVLAHNLAPRQTLPSVSSVSAPQTTSSISLPPPCCWFWNGFQGVRVNTWYSEVVTLYTATVITTYVQYSGSSVVANSTTSYQPSNETFTQFGYHGPAGDGIRPTLPGVNATIVPDGLMDDGEYGATSIFRSNETYATFDFTDLTIYSPTPYAIFGNIQLYTNTPPYSILGTLSAQPTSYLPQQCGTRTERAYLSYTAGSWQYVNKTELVPFYDNLVTLLEGDDTGYSITQVVVPLSAAFPNDRIFASFPDGLSSALVANKTLLSMYPWITNCYTFGGEGQPTVHIEVDQLTSTSSTVITASAEAVQTSSTALPSPPISTVATQTTTRTNLPSPTTTTSDHTVQSTSSGDAAAGAKSSNSPSPLSNVGGSLSDTATASTLSATAGQSTGSTGAAASPQAATTSSILNGIVTIGSTTATFQLQTSAAVIAGTTLTIGSPGAVVNSQTLSLMRQSDGNIAVVVDGTTTQAFPTTTPQAVTIGGQTLTVAAGTSAVVVGSVTLKSGEATVINGDTVSIAGTNIVVAGSGTTTTQGLGGAIISGLGGGGTPSSTVLFRGAGAQLSPSKFAVISVLGLLLVL